MNENQIKNIKQKIHEYLTNDIYTIDQYTELEDKYLNVQYHKEHFDKVNFKNSIKDGLTDEDYKNFMTKLIDFRMNNAAKALAQNALDELKNSHLYFEVDLSFKLPHHIVTIQDFKSVRINTSGLNPPKELVKLNDNLDTDIYLDFAIHIFYILSDTYYYVLVYDDNLNKFTFKGFEQNNEIEFNSEVKLCQNNGNFYIAYKNGLPIFQHS